MQSGKDLHPKAKRLIYKSVSSEKKEELQYNQYSNKLQMTDKIRELFKEKYPNLRETITTRLLTCLTCGKRVCRDVNGAFNILTNFLDSIYNGSLGLSTLKHLKKKEPPGPMSALSPKRPKKPRSEMKPIEKTSRVKQLKLGNPK